MRDNRDREVACRRKQRAVNTRTRSRKQEKPANGTHLDILQPPIMLFVLDCLDFVLPLSARLFYLKTRVKTDRNEFSSKQHCHIAVAQAEFEICPRNCGGDFSPTVPGTPTRGSVPPTDFCFRIILTGASPEWMLLTLVHNVIHNISGYASPVVLLISSLVS